MENKKSYIQTLLEATKSLENRILQIQNEDVVSFSFLHEAFEYVENIQRTLHSLEFIQIEDMKNQMNRLIDICSKKELAATASENVAYFKKEEPVVADKCSKDDSSKGNFYAQGLVLPEYKRTSELTEAEINSQIEEEITPHITLIGDYVKSENSTVELPVKMSLNDRFLFQRELFNNDRQAMNSLMLRLNAFGNYKDAEDYLRGYTNWNFDDENVKHFLSVIKNSYD